MAGYGNVMMTHAFLDYGVMCTSSMIELQSRTYGSGTDAYGEKMGGGGAGDGGGGRGCAGKKYGVERRGRGYARAAGPLRKFV